MSSWVCLFWAIAVGQELDEASLVPPSPRLPILRRPIHSVVANLSRVVDAAGFHPLDPIGEPCFLSALSQPNGVDNLLDRRREFRSSGAERNEAEHGVNG